MPVAAEPPPRKRKRLIGELLLRNPQRRENAGERHGRRALDVVVIGADLVAIALEDRHGVDVGEILPLNAAFGIKRLHGLDEFVDEGVVFRAAHAVLRETEIERVFEQFLIVGADIERDRQAILRRHAGAGGVERELADRNAHAADA